jgi:hypothetical protein
MGKLAAGICIAAMAVGGVSIYATHNEQAAKVKADQFYLFWDNRPKYA